METYHVCLVNTHEEDVVKLNEMMENGRLIRASEKGPRRHVQDDGHDVPLIMCVRHAPPPA